MTEIEWLVKIINLLEWVKQSKSENDLVRADGTRKVPYPEHWDKKK